MAVKTILWDMPGVLSKDNISAGCSLPVRGPDFFELFLGSREKSGRMLIMNLTEVFGTADVKVNSVKAEFSVKRDPRSEGKVPSELYISVYSGDGCKEICRDTEIFRDIGTSVRKFSKVFAGHEFNKITAFPEFNIDKGIGFELGFENKDSSYFDYVILSEISFVFDVSLPMCSLILKSEPAGAGILTGAGNYEFGSEVTVNASAADFYRFDSWSDSVKENTRKIIIKDNSVLTAKFTEIKNIYAGKLPVREIYAGNIKVKAVYVGNKRIY